MSSRTSAGRRSPTPSFTAPPDRPLPPLPDMEDRLSPRDAFTFHPSHSSPALTQDRPTSISFASPPSLSPPLKSPNPMRRPSLVFDKVAEEGKPKREDLRRARSFSFIKLERGNREEEPHQPMPSRRDSGVGLSFLAPKTRSAEATPKEEAKPRKSGFNFFRRPSAAPSVPSAALSPPLVSPASPMASPQLPSLETGQGLALSFSNDVYASPSVDSLQEAPAMSERTRSAGASTPARPRSSTQGSVTTAAVGRVRAAMRRSNSISSVTSPRASPPPPVSTAMGKSTSTGSTSGSPLKSSIPPGPGARRPSTSGSVTSGMKSLLSFGRRRSSAASMQPSPWLPSASMASSSMVDEPTEEEVLSGSPPSRVQDQLLPVPVVSRRASSSSLSSSGSFRTSGATTEATSQRPTSRKPSLTLNPSRSSPTTATTPTPSPSKASLKREQDESPEHYLARLREVCAPSEIARVLASHNDPAHIAALQAYVSSFEFTGDPIDIALRKLLMELTLPKETQQIDRVMEAFAQSYHQQNPSLFPSYDQPYLLAFASILLHSDAFNANNKSKMSKAAFIKNTRSDNSLPVEVLSYLYDNICFSPFIFVDEVDINGQRSVIAETSSSTFLSSIASKPRVDPYYLIQQKLTRTLRAEVELHIPSKNPFSFTGTTPFFNSSSLHRAFAEAPLLPVTAPVKAPPVVPPHAHREVLVPVERADGSLPPSPSPALPPAEAESGFRITKVGLLVRKDLAIEGGKKAPSRKWREWSVLLTGSQLLFFRDPAWANDLGGQLLKAEEGSLERLEPPKGLLFRPDAVLSLQDAVSVFDWTYTRKANCFTLHAAGGQAYLFQAPDATEMNEWIATINYAASFKTAGVRMRSPTSGRPMAASTPAFQLLPAPSPKMKASVVSSITARSSEASTLPDISTEVDSLPSDLSAQLSPPIDSPASPIQMPSEWDDDYVFEQFSSSDLRYRPPSSPATSANRFLGASRSDIVRSKIASLEQAIAADKASLQADLRLARHLAVLTPFLSSTRTRIQEAVEPLARRVRLTRLAICKSVVMREVLARDLLAEEREAQRARQYRPRATDEDAVDLLRRPSRNRVRRSMTDASMNGSGVLSPPLEEVRSPNSRSETPTTATPSVHPLVEDEQAAPWETTRAGAGKRVSLVHVELPTGRDWLARQELSGVDERSDAVSFERRDV